jgi:hypothetical protein
MGFIGLHPAMMRCRSRLRYTGHSLVQFGTWQGRVGTRWPCSSSQMGEAIHDRGKSGPLQPEFADHGAGQYHVRYLVMRFCHEHLKSRIHVGR